MTTSHYHGHRERLRTRFLQQGLPSFADYEALELLLLYVARQKDMKPVAKALIERFGSLKEVLDATPEELQQVKGIGPAAITLIRFVKETAARYLQQSSRARFRPEGPEALAEYCILSMGSQPNEVFRVLCLDSQFGIIHEADVSEGIVNQATVHPRRVVELALRHGASILVLVHNHPDGNLMPSDFDKTLTRSLVLATKTVGVGVYDHLIVSRDGCYSFREQGLL